MCVYIYIYIYVCVYMYVIILAVNPQVLTESTGILNDQRGMYMCIYIYKDIDR